MIFVPLITVKMINFVRKGTQENVTIFVPMDTVNLDVIVNLHMKKKLLKILEDLSMMMKSVGKKTKI